MTSSKSGFEKFFDQQMKKPSFAKGYKKARAEIDAVDKLVRALDDARVKTGMSKAELARLISAKPEIVRRLFTSKANPTLETFTKLAAALGYRLELVPGSPASRPSSRRVIDHASTLLGLRARYSAPSRRTSA